MLSHEITSVVGRKRGRKRIGRGVGSGHGKTSGKGHKGQLSRAGAPRLTLKEGGQMPLYRRIPKRGFNNANFEKRYEIVNISQLDRFEEGAIVDLEQLSNAGLIDSISHRVKILGDGELTKKLEVNAHKFSKSAEQKIVALGGTAKVLAG
ncbi:MAG: 50S ribosomal protein L15 [Phycisphaerae bacterium]|jgi:large subunit ribosomal protein L15